jgi:hypothetical protein
MMAVVISTNYVLSAPGNVFPLNHGRIGYIDYARSGTVTPSTEAVGFEADATQNRFTYDLYRPTALPATLTYDLGAAKAYNYIGIAGHTLGTAQTTVVAEYSTDNITYTTLDVDHIPANDRAIMLLFDEVTARYMRLTLSGATIPSISVVYCGSTLDMYRPFYSGHTPGVLSRMTTVKPNKSVGGQWLGRSVIRQGLSAQYKWNNTPLSWYETYMDPFSKAAITDPFFIAWNPLEHPTHVLYAWTSEDVKPTLSGTLDFCEFGFSVDGIE